MPLESKPVSTPSEGFGSLWSFYAERNPKTLRYRWEHRAPERMTEIMIMIAESGQATETTRNKAINWLAEHGKI
jgi:hypothetical protein